jgi:hypothetical protein
MNFRTYISTLLESENLSDIKIVLKELGFVKVTDKNLISYNIPETGIFANFISEDDIDGGIEVKESDSKTSKQLYAFDVHNFHRKRRIIKQLIDHLKTGSLTNSEQDFYDEKLNK